MAACPHCLAERTRVERNAMNALRICGSCVLLPFYIAGGLAGDHRGPILPLERRCMVCGRMFKARSIFDALVSPGPKTRRKSNE